MEFLALLPSWVKLLIILSIPFSALAALFEFMEYWKDRMRTKAFYARCIAVNAVVTEPYVSDLTAEKLRQEIAKFVAEQALSSLTGTNINMGAPTNTVNTRVTFETEDGTQIETLITRHAGTRICKRGSKIRVYYDPKLPQHAFPANEHRMRRLKPLHNSILFFLYMCLMIVCLFFI